MSFARYAVKRISTGVVQLFVIVSITFGMIRLLPGGPMSALRAKLMQQNSGMSQQQIEQLVAVYTNMQPNTPLYIQYYHYLAGLVQGNFGKSISLQQPVSKIIVRAAPWTLFVMTVALLLMFTIGVLLGGLLAYIEGSSSDYVGSGISLVLHSTPYYVAAILFIYFLGYQGPFPTGGHAASGVQSGFTVTYLGSVLMHGALPIASLVITGFGGWALSMRGNAISVLGEDYLRVAQLRGLPTSRIATRYVTRNAILPMYTGLLIALGSIFGGSVILEQIFSYPGLGYYMFQAIGSRDYPLMMGSFILITVMVIAGIVVADLTYGFVDPRVSHGGEN